MKKRRIMALIITVFFSLNTNMVLAYTNSEQKKNNNKIEDLNNQQENIEQEKKILEDNIKQLTDDISEKTRLITEKNNSMKELQNKIKTLQEKTSITEIELKKIKDNIIIKEGEHKEKEDLLAQRLRSMYKNNTYSNLILFLIESDSFSQLISNFSNMNKIIEYDQELIKETEKLREELKISEKTLSDEIENLENEKNELNISEENVKNEKKDLEKFIDELKSIENNKQSKIKSLSSAQKELQKEIYDLEFENENVQKNVKKVINSANNQQEESSIKPSSDKWIFPVNDSVTSSFGYRIHPVTGEKKLHTGTDFGSPLGTPVKASKDGKVIFSGVNAGYGNCVIIDHGSGIQTLYAHNSELNVSEGQIIKQGQVISKVGSTGMSTGPHLHFEVRVNGEFKDPMSYLN